LIEQCIPFNFGFLKLLLHQRRADIMVAENGSVGTLSGFVEFDGVVLDGGSLELLSDSMFYIARCLPNLEKTLCALSSIE